ncbi:hypothetical protein SUGI_0861820 [Cryptomeria japonica]|nr:hypothetical protein SUGI_0861820 [Cryptomeria japonica]
MHVKALLNGSLNSAIQIPDLPDQTNGSWEWNHKRILTYDKADSENVGALTVLFLPGFGMWSFHYENQLTDLGRILVHMWSRGLVSLCIHWICGVIRFAILS